MTAIRWTSILALPQCQCVSFSPSALVFDPFPSLAVLCMQYLLVAQWSAGPSGSAGSLHCRQANFALSSCWPAGCNLIAPCTIPFSTEKVGQSWLIPFWGGAKLCKSCLSEILSFYGIDVASDNIESTAYSSTLCSKTCSKLIWLKHAKTPAEISLQPAREGIEMSNRSGQCLIRLRVSMPAVCCTFDKQKRDGGLGILTVVVGNNWVILPKMSTLPWPILVCCLILNHQLHPTQQNIVGPLRELRTPVKLITFQMVDTA